MNKKGQLATEYLIIVSVVIIITVLIGWISGLPKRTCDNVDYSVVNKVLFSMVSSSADVNYKNVSFEKYGKCFVTVDICNLDLNYCQSTNIIVGNSTKVKE